MVVVFSARWKVLKDIIVEVGKIGVNDSVFDSNNSHMSNYNVLAKIIMERAPQYQVLSKTTSDIFKLTKTLTEHKAEYEGKVSQAMYELVNSFLTSQQKPAVQKPINPNVIKHTIKPKITRKQEVAKTISKKMVLDFMGYCNKYNKNQVLLQAGMTDHTEELAELDILK